MKALKTEVLEKSRNSGVGPLRAEFDAKLLFFPWKRAVLAGWAHSPRLSRGSCTQLQWLGCKMPLLPALVAKSGF